MAHVRQKHTLDVLVIELFHTVFWFNPFFQLLAKAIRLNHEFLADQTAIEIHKNIAQYQLLLLQRASGYSLNHLASNLSYLLTKKRLIMMTKSESKRMAFFKKIALVPLLLGLVFVFATQGIAQDDATPKMMDEFKTIAKKAKEKGLKALSEKEQKRLHQIYHEMTKKQKESVASLGIKFGEHEGHDGDWDHDNHGHDGDHGEHGPHDKHEDGHDHDHDEHGHHEYGDGHGHDNDASHKHGKEKGHHKNDGDREEHKG